MKKIFCIVILVFVCVSHSLSEVKRVTCNKWGESLYYGEQEKMVNVSRYVWYNGQEKLDLSPENANIYGIGSGYCEKVSDTYEAIKKAEEEAARYAERDFKMKMKMFYLTWFSEDHNEAFYDNMIKRTTRGFDWMQSKKADGSSIVISYCVIQLSRGTIEKYYPEILEIKGIDLEN